MHTPVLYLRNYCTDCAEIWYVVSIYTDFTDVHVRSGVGLHVRTCAPLPHISGTTEPIEPKFGTWVVSTDRLVYIYRPARYWQQTTVLGPLTGGVIRGVENDWQVCKVVKSMV